MSRRETESEHGLVTETQKKVKRPPLYKVLLHNDDYTTKEFVVQILQYVFHKEQTEAVQIMLHVHKKGIGVAGVYTYEIAETKVAQVNSATTVRAAISSAMLRRANCSHRSRPAAVWNRWVTVCACGASPTNGPASPLAVPRSSGRPPPECSATGLTSTHIEAAG